MHSRHNSVEHISTARRSCDNCCTRRYCLVSRIDERLTPGLSKAMRAPRILARGERLFIQGDKFYSIYLVRSGTFKSYIIDDTGDRQITGFHFAADILGLDGVQSGRHGLEIEALETSSVCVVPFCKLEQGFGQNQSGLYRYLIGAASGSAYQQSYLLMLLGRLHAAQRLASFLLDISRKMGERGGSESEFHLTMPRYDIANYLGMAVETVSRLFKRFEKQNLIKVERRHLKIIDRDGLLDTLSSDHRFSALRNTA